MEERKIESALTEALFTILTPLVRILLRNGATYRAFADVARQVFVRVASEPEFQIKGRKHSDSRISVITGLTRKEVSRLREMEGPPDATELYAHNRASRVIKGWISDPDFTEKGGEARMLPQEGARGFSELVKRYSGDAPARAVLDELERVGAVQRLADERVLLVERAYIPRSDSFEQIGVLSFTVGRHLETVDHNLRSSREDARYHRLVGNDQPVPEDLIPGFQQIIRRKGQALQEQLDRWLDENERFSRSDRRLRIGAGLFFFAMDA